jgi:hypothetical protein
MDQEEGFERRLILGDGEADLATGACVVGRIDHLAPP